MIPLRDMISEGKVSLLGRDTILFIAMASFIFPSATSFLGMRASGATVALCAILMASTVASLCAQGHVKTQTLLKAFAGIVLSSFAVFSASNGAAGIQQAFSSVTEYVANNPSKISLIPVLVLFACYLLVPFVCFEQYGLKFISHVETTVAAPAHVFYPAVAKLTRALKTASTSESDSDSTGIAGARSASPRSPRKSKRHKRRKLRASKLASSTSPSKISESRARSPIEEPLVSPVRHLEALDHDATVRWMQSLNLGHLNPGKEVDGALLMEVLCPEDLDQLVPNLLERRKLCRCIQRAKEFGVVESLISKLGDARIEPAVQNLSFAEPIKDDVCALEEKAGCTSDAGIQANGCIPRVPSTPPSIQDNRVAIVGYSCILPGGQNVSESWQMIVDGLDCISDLPSDRVDVTSYWHPDKKTKDKIYCKRGGFIPNFEFEPRQYNLNLKQMEDTDTNQTLTLLKVKEALEDAGIAPFSKTKKNIGCVLGIGGGQKASNEFYSRLNYVVVEKVLRKMGMPRKDIDAAVEKFKAHYPEWRLDSFPGFLGNVTSGRVTNVFNMDGMNCVVDAACASSLVSVKVAIDELLHGNCSTMIAGATCTDCSIGMYMAFSKTPVFSTKPSVTAYDENTGGMLIGEGSVMFVLKRYADAIADGDRVHAIIRGCASSSDGRASGIYAPTISGQQLAIERAYERAGVKPSQVTMVEGHGTGTPVGDKVELTALKNVFDGRKEKVAVGSIKSNIGHLKAVAGMAGLMKTILALKHKTLPQSINVENPPKLRDGTTIQNSALYINTRLRPWFVAPNQKRIAGISSFGFGVPTIIASLKKPSMSRHHHTVSTASQC